jgi:hypothetical protein
MQELRAIRGHSHSSQHVLLIDDARDFTGHNDYPKIESLVKYFRENWPTHLCDLQDDIVRVCPTRGR